MKKAYILILFLTSCSLLSGEEGQQCKQDYDCGKCVDRVLFGMSCDRGDCDPSTQYTQFDCTQEIKREFGPSYSGTCVEDSQGAHCAVANIQGAKSCANDDDCSRCAGRTQYTATCNAQSHQCEEEDVADCNSIIEAQFGKPGTCRMDGHKAICVTE